MSQLFRVPPSSEVMAILYTQYLTYGLPNGLSFKQYLEVIGFTDPAVSQEGMDDGVLVDPNSRGPDLIRIPNQPVTGNVHIKVLLIDFPDREGTLPVQHYKDLLFSNEKCRSGSMADYYREVSLGKVDISGSVHGWLRMPETYSFYTNGESGTNRDSYPRNAQRMAEDAVRTAVDQGIEFEDALDSFGQGIITALFLVHAGRGAETTHPSISGKEIWSHKWQLRTPVEVSPKMCATIYLTVPHDCKIGVCAHELGHLVFQWQDFYDPNYDEDGSFWDGSGNWDLMAGGSYNGGGTRPAHPAALHKLQHGWIDLATIKDSASVKLDPYTADDGKVIKLVSKAYQKGQYLLLENRTRRGFDYHLPGEGLLVWAVDETRPQTSPNRPGLLLIQADGRRNLEDPRDWNQGDAGDPFPGLTEQYTLFDKGKPGKEEISTSFEGGDLSGIILKDIDYDSDKIVSLNIEFVT